MSESLTQILEHELASLTFDTKAKNVGTVERVGDGIVFAQGLSQAKMGELVQFGNDRKGLILNLEQDRAGIIVLGDYELIKEGDKVETTAQPLIRTNSQHQS